MQDSCLTGYLKNEQASKQLAKHFAEVLSEIKEQKTEQALGMVFFLEGDLGAGKTFFARACIQAFLPKQKVKSPTYTLVESYSLPPKAIKFFHRKVQHFDLYRLCDPEELEYLGVRELLTESFCSFIEWSNNGKGVLPEKPDLNIAFDYKGNAREFKVKAFSNIGLSLLNNLYKKIGTSFDL